MSSSTPLWGLQVPPQAEGLFGVTEKRAVGSLNARVLWLSSGSGVSP